MPQEKAKKPLDPAEIRALFPITRQRVYLFSGGIAPAFIHSQKAVARYMRQLTDNPSLLFRQSSQIADRTRHLFAQLIGADKSEVALTDCTGTGSNMAIEMIEPQGGFPAGSNVVLDDLAYPSSVYPWMLPHRRHVELRFVNRRDDGLIHQADLSDALDESTVALSVSHVSQQTGFRHNLKSLADLAHRHGIPLLVDAMQSVGALDIQVHDEGVDFLCCGAMKWLLGSAGVGFFYAAPKHVESSPMRTGYMGALRDERQWGERRFQPKVGGERFELGMWNLVGLVATIPGLELLLDLGVHRVERHVLELTGYCIGELHKRDFRVLTPSAAENRAGIVSIEMERAEEAFSYLTDRGVDGYRKGEILRVDCHIFNNREDIDRFLTTLDAF